MNEALVAVRAIHFASTAMTAGVLVCFAIVADPVLRAAAPEARSTLWTQSLRIAWAGLALTVLSGAAWVLVQTAAMSGRPLAEAVADGVVWIVLSDTQFGVVASIRLTLAIVLATSLACADAKCWTHFVPPTVATGLVAAVAWTGHAAGTVGANGAVHLAADALHLMAAATWIGGLVPLGLLLSWARRHVDQRGVSIASDAARRFSTLGFVSVATLLATGIVNSWILVGSFRGLVGTDYGRLLLVKIALFAAMTSVAAVNRMRLAPRLFEPQESHLQIETIGDLIRNIMIEIALGLSIFALVGVLGTLHPAIHIVRS